MIGLKPLLSLICIASIVLAGCGEKHENPKHSMNLRTSMNLRDSMDLRNSMNGANSPKPISLFRPMPVTLRESKFV